MSATKRGPGRPKGSGENTEVLRLRLPGSLKALAHEAAEREGLDDSEWWREAARQRLLAPKSPSK